MDNFISTTVLFFILIDPIGLALILPSLLKNVPPNRARKIILREMLIALVILLTFFFLGNQLLATLDIERSTLSISGAVVLFLIALGMVFPTIGNVTSSTPHHDNSTSSEDAEPFIVPIAIPLIAGPSSIAVVMINGANYIDTTSSLLFIASICVAWILSLGVLLISPKLVKLLGRRGSFALERLIGILLILISVQMLMNGLKEYSTNLGTATSQATQHAE